MAHRGFLKVAMTKTAKSGKTYVSLLILNNPSDEDGQWMGLWDKLYFGGTEKGPSDFDIREYADKENPTPVVYEAETNGDFVNCIRIRPDTDEYNEKLNNAMDAVVEEQDATPLLRDEARDDTHESLQAVKAYLEAGLKKVNALLEVS